jgi:hypothetical protein
VIIERDPKSPCNGYSARSYVKTLERGLLPFYKPGEIFMQDNARIYTAHIVQEFFISHSIHVMDWPPFLPDLNLIEHM